MTEITRDYYKVLLVGQSGKGKTYAFRNMNPDKTGFINVENKPLPFKNNFKNHVRVNDYQTAFNTLVAYGLDDTIEVIVVDSISAYFDQVLKVAKATKKNFDIWNMLNDEIAKFIDMIKRVPKEVFVTGHYEILNLEGNSEKRVKVQGKQFEGVIEKDFTMVLYAENRFIEGNPKPVYQLHLCGEGTSAKCPPDIFGEDTLIVPNDAQFVTNKILEFVR